MDVNRVNEARTAWGRVFNEFRLACEWDNSARYQVTDKLAWYDEVTRRLQALSKDALKKCDEMDVLRKQEQGNL